MKDNIIIRSIFLALVLSANFCAGQPKILTSDPSPKGTTYSKEEAGVLYVTLCSSDSGNQFAPIMYWKAEGRREIIELDDLSSLDEMIRSGLAASLQKKSNKEIITDVAMMLGAYVNNRTDNIMLLEPVRTEYVKELSNHISATEYKRVEPCFLAAPVKISDSTWELGFLVRTKRGSLERRTFGGSFSPFAVLKLQTEVLLPNGTLPDFPFSP